MKKYIWIALAAAVVALSLLTVPPAVTWIRDRWQAQVEQLNALETETDNELYYCRSLLKDEELEAYDRIYAALVSHRTRFFVSDVHGDRVFELVDYVEYDHPEIIWEQGEMYSSLVRGVNSGTQIEVEYSMTQQEGEETMAQVDAQLRPVLDSLRDLDDYGKVKGVYEYLIDHITYVDEKDDQTLCTALLEGQGVCAGYARAAQYMLQQLGVQTLYCSGDSDGEAHGWNIVRIHGGYYNMDVTWGDVEDEDIWGADYSFMTFSDAEAAQHYTPDELYELPACTAVTDGYYHREGCYLELYRFSAVRDCILRSLERDEAWCSIQFADERALNRARSALFESGCMMGSVCDAVWAATGREPEYYYEWTDETNNSLNIQLIFEE